MKRPKRWLGFLVLGVAACLSYVLVHFRLRMQPASVSAYELALVHAESTTLHYVAKPVGSVTGVVGVRAYILRGEQAIAWAAPYETTQEGIVRFRVDKPSDDDTLLFAVGRPELLPAPARVTAQLAHLPERAPGLTLFQIRPGDPNRTK